CAQLQNNSEAAPRKRGQTLYYKYPGTALSPALPFPRSCPGHPPQSSEGSPLLPDLPYTGQKPCPPSGRTGEVPWEGFGKRQISVSGRRTPEGSSLPFPDVWDPSYFPKHIFSEGPDGR